MFRFLTFILGKQAELDGKCFSSLGWWGCPEKSLFPHDLAHFQSGEGGANEGVGRLNQLFIALAHPAQVANFGYGVCLP